MAAQPEPQPPPEPPPPPPPPPSDQQLRRHAAGLLAEAGRLQCLTPKAAALMLARLNDGVLSPASCVAAAEARLAHLGVRPAHVLPLRPQPEPEPEPETEPAWQPALSDIVRECLRCVVVEAEQRAEKGPEYFDPAACYQRRPGKSACKNGAVCRQESGWHWYQFDHPADHALLASQPRAFAALATWRLSAMSACRHYAKSGKCLFGDACRFEHAPRPPVAPLPWEAGAGGLAVSAAGARRGGRKPRKKRSKNGPTAGFRRFLVDTFGMETLRSGAGVLDVAGGAGTLSYELVHLNGVSSTIADPRQPCFIRAKRTVEHRQRQAQLGGQSVAPALRKYDTATPPAGSKLGDRLVPAAGKAVALGELLPDWAEVWFGRWLWEGAERGTIGAPPASMFSKDVKEVDRWDNTRQTMQDDRDGEQVSAQQVEGNSDGSGEVAATGQQPPSRELMPTLMPSAVAQVLQDCSVVLGLHPDGATDAIVEFALQHSKPFAVLPCCVYRKTFTHRRLPNGEPVRNYDDLVDYLQAMDPGINRATLDEVDGRNTVLYHMGCPIAAGSI